MGKGKKKSKKKSGKKHAQQQSRKMRQQQNQQKQQQREALKTAAAAEAIPVREPVKIPEKPVEVSTEKKVETPEENQAASEKKISWKKAWMMFGAGAFGVLLAVYISGMIYMQDKFVMQTVINGIDASFDTVSEVEQKIADMTGTYQIELSERGGGKETVKADQIGYRYVSKGEVQEFKKQQNLFLWPAALFQKSEYTFASSTEFDEKKLDRAVEKLECCDRKQTKAPTDAYMKLKDGVYEMVKETQGNLVKKNRLKNVLRKAISKGETEISLEAKGCYVKPKITEKNKVLNKTIRNMNRYMRTRILYLFGEEQEILDGNIISKWLSCDDQGEVTLDEEKIALYVDYLAERYDTYGKLRRFETNDGEILMVESGKYGWLIDREAETEALKELVFEGKRLGRQPVYAHTAVSREGNELGPDYVEVDLTNQHVWMYIDGKEIVSTDMVSGTYTNPSRRTPPGTFTLNYKKSPAVLTSTTPGDSYESPVTYWMPFNGGIGLHDANWRGSFGGNIYQYGGSHGCINLPTGAAGEIYRNIYPGMPVICYYR